MKEVKAGCYAGPYDSIPFDNFIQSPIGLLPKANGKTRLIFHLSYQFSEQEDGRSVNKCMPKEWCSVKYNDLDDAVATLLRISGGTEVVYIGKTDLTSAFRALPLKIGSFCWLVLKAEDPTDGKTKYFVDKCLPFGASISCAHYQHFSNALKHVVMWQTGTKNKAITNYLDDFLFLALRKWICDNMIRAFLQVCGELNVPVAIEKTEWSEVLMVFLGILLDGQNHILSIPTEKKDKALKLINEILSKKKTTVKQLQVLTGFLNFLTKAIPAGWMFTRRMYAKFANLGDTKLKQYQHIRVDPEFKLDCEVWRLFLTHYAEVALCRPMIDLKKTVTAQQICFYSDTSACKTKGVGAVFNKHWLFAQWEPGYIDKNSPSIEYLELYGLVAAMITWGHYITNSRVIVYCDNESVVSMVNNMVSSCGNCMYLIKLLALNNLIYNRGLFVQHLRSEENFLSDALSRLQFNQFWHLAPRHMDKTPTKSLHYCGRHHGSGKHYKIDAHTLEMKTKLLQLFLQAEVSKDL